MLSALILSLIGNMDANFADMLELVWVFLTLVVSLVLVTLLGRWWER